MRALEQTFFRREPLLALELKKKTRLQGGLRCAHNRIDTL